mmetsp:Transcript_4484/g.9956  ORF Transcript_4484/g.9956 Transcript_4484/m.9956 type:complete len:253 (-) Transcript_4484:1135-1893(-)
MVEPPSMMRIFPTLAWLNSFIFVDSSYVMPPTINISSSCDRGIPSTFDELRPPDTSIGCVTPLSFPRVAFSTVSISTGECCEYTLLTPWTLVIKLFMNLLAASLFVPYSPGPRIFAPAYLRIASTSATPSGGTPPRLIASLTAGMALVAAVSYRRAYSIPSRSLSGIFTVAESKFDMSCFRCPAWSSAHARSCSNALTSIRLQTSTSLASSPMMATCFETACDWLRSSGYFSMNCCMSSIDCRFDVFCDLAW